jgi:hypothetical protein
MFPGAAANVRQLVECGSAIAGPLSDMERQ